MTYLESIAFLDELTNFERLDGYTYDSKNFGVERMRRLLAELGDPQLKFGSVIVAGTKGKGSTAAMLAAIMGAAGRSVGLYTSPHLIEYRERIRIGLDPVSAYEFGRLAGRLVDPVARLNGAGKDLRPTTFEVLTAMALEAFAERAVDVAVLEVGMGGRLDAVNVVDPTAVCITPISLDHTDQLGATVESIAREKAGVIKSPSPVVSGPQRPEVLDVIAAACERVRAPLHIVGRDILGTGVSCGLDGSCFTATTSTKRYDRLRLSLLGRHQIDNALAAIGVSAVLGTSSVPGARAVDDESVRRGLAMVDWPGRMQVMRTDPYVILDCAHNVESASVLARACNELLGPRRTALVFGQLRGKDHDEVAKILCSMAARVYIPELAHPRAFAAADLARIAMRFAPDVSVYANAAGAFRAAQGQFVEKNDVILVTGSVSLVGEILREGIA